MASPPGCEPVHQFMRVENQISLLAVLKYIGFEPLEFLSPPHDARVGAKPPLQTLETLHENRSDGANPADIGLSRREQGGEMNVIRVYATIVNSNAHTFGIIAQNFFTSVFLNTSKKEFVAFKTRCAGNLKLSGRFSRRLPLSRLPPNSVLIFSRKSFCCFMRRNITCVSEIQF